MTTETRRRLSRGGLWVSVGVNVVSGVIDLAQQRWGWAGLACTVVAWLLAVLWLFDWTDRWMAASLREATAKASFAETLLARLKEGGGFAVDLSAPDEAPGTKH